ncbi:hypothetical protein DFH28DRAFT_1130654 [Melampsora americana]|nr:hypothetical protein DFH28DRAFT_1130654 [Melampsora americana]
MKKTTSKFLSVLIPAQSASPSKSSDHQDLDQEKLQPHFKRKNSSESHHPNKRSRVTQDFSPLNDSEDENDLTPFETHSPGSTRQTTVSLSRPQSPTLGYDSDFNPNHSSPPSTIDI